MEPDQDEIRRKRLAKLAMNSTPPAATSGSNSSTSTANETSGSAQSETTTTSSPMLSPPENPKGKPMVASGASVSEQILDEPMDTSPIKRSASATATVMSIESSPSSAMASKEGSKSPTPGPENGRSGSGSGTTLNRGQSTISNDFDSGIEGMEVEEASSQSNNDRPSTEKRKRTSSSISDPHRLLDTLQSILRVQLPNFTQTPDFMPLSDLAEMLTDVCNENEIVSLTDPSKDYNELISDILTEVLTKIASGGPYPPGIERTCGATGKDVMLSYLLECYRRHEAEQKSLRKSDTAMTELLHSLHNQIIQHASLVLQDVFESEIDNGIPKSPLLKPLLEQKLAGFLIDLVVLTAPDWQVFKTIFVPLVDSLVTEVRNSCMSESSFKAPLLAITELCDLRIGAAGNVRPFCQLLTEMPTWIPGSVSEWSGREMTVTSVLGPFFGVSVFPEEDPSVAEKYFSGKQSTSVVKTTAQQLQHDLEFLRVSLHKMTYSLLANSQTRESTLDFLNTILKRNAKRQQMQINEREVAGDGFMLNFLSVMQMLSMKIKFEKIDCNYLVHPKSKLVMKDETRLKMNAQEVDEWLAEYKSKTDWNEPNFHTECWFLTLEAHHLGIMPCIRRYQRRIRLLREYQRMVEELEKMPSMGQRSKLAIKKYKMVVKKLSKSKACADTGLLHISLFQRCLQFFSSVAQLLLSLMQGLVSENGFAKLPGSLPALPLNSSVPKIFASLPEWIVDDMADFILFAMQHFPGVLVDYIDDKLLTYLLTMVCSPNYFNNPYLVSKIIEIFYVINPTVQDRTQELFVKFMSHPISEEFLPSSLMKFYTDVEQTGASSEFYDKFTIRYHISIIMKSMWESPVHKIAIINESKSGKHFVKFINMLMNDTIFLLDESMDTLKKIHEYQEKMSDKAKWEQQSQEQRQNQQRDLVQFERQCRSYLTLARETVDMMHYLSQDIKEPFLRPELADRLAALLNCNLQQLCGAKCKNLKVNKPEKYNWEPKWLLSHLIDIYLHLNSETLASAIANDQRSFSIELFEDAATRMDRTLDRSQSDIDSFRKLSEQANSIVLANLKKDEDYDDAPEEFMDPMMYEIMEDPVLLPTSGKIMDRKHIYRHLLSTQNDPFNRLPLNEEMLKPATDLKEKIDQWKKEKDKQKSDGSQ